MTQFKYTDGGDFDVANAVDVVLDSYGNLASVFLDGTKTAQIYLFSDADLGFYAQLFHRPDLSAGYTTDTERSPDSAGWLLDFTGASASARFSGGSYGDVLIGGDADDTLNGLAGNDSIVGNDGDDLLNGGAGNDTMIGGAGADTMVGGDGDDSYTVDDAGDVVTEVSGEGTDTVSASFNYTLGDNAENLILTGADVIGTGNGLDNILIGSSGDNWLDGGEGADTLIGGDGDETYAVDDEDDVVIELSGEGTDTVTASVSYTLGDNVEHLLLLGAAIFGTGNGLDNQLFGNGEDNVLNGGQGSDEMLGAQGDDTYYVDDENDIVAEYTGEGTDIVYSSIDLDLASFTFAGEIEYLALTGSAISGTGNGLDNQLFGNSEDNVLDGGLGADEMLGDQGDDIYYVDDESDIVTEVSGEGTDTVSASVSFTLGDEVENLILTGAAVIGTGNELDNELTGNEENNVLDGGEGADTLIGGDGDDRYTVDDADDIVTEVSGEGTDTVSASVNFILGAEIENLTLTGSAIVGIGNGLDNELTGNEENNELDGGSGADTMVGGDGDDFYFVDDEGDIVTEVTGEGTDTISASIDTILGANLEKLILTGTAFSGTGNGLDNELFGNNGGNLLFGRTGSDTLYGLGGNDTIFGGTGDDVLLGGRGNDKIYVRAGADTVVFDDGDTKAWRGNADLVIGFRGRLGDRIDLTSVDADSTTAGDQDFTFIGSDRFDGVAGELRFYQHGSDTYLAADTDGDRVADLTIRFDRHMTFVDDFILG